MNTELIDKAVEHLNEAEKCLLKSIDSGKKTLLPYLRLSVSATASAREWLEIGERKMLNDAARERFCEGKK